MNWVQLVIPLIALGVWILASIIGNVQQQKQNAPRRNLPKPPQRLPDMPLASDGDPLRPTEEQERKLDEAKRRRKVLAERQTGLEHQRQVERDQVRRRGVPEPEVAKTVEAAPEPARRRDRKDPHFMPAPAVREGSRSRNVDPAPLTGLAAISPTNLVQSLGPAAQVKRDAPSPVALEIHRLLQNPRSLAAAFVLREVFDAPAALRRRKRK